MRYFVQLSYRGTRYAGWQVQPNALAVQQVLDERLGLTIGQQVHCIGCGRTDTGVHARRFFAHFDVEEPLANPETAAKKLDRFLPEDISVQRIWQVQDDAHARFSAIERTYLYMIHRRKDPFLQGLSAHVHGPLDIGTMRICAQKLAGEHDFTTFSKHDAAYRNYNCYVGQTRLFVRGERVFFLVSANRFLRGMVRLVVGNLLAAGRGKLSTERFQEVFEAKDRSLSAGAAPPEGLYLWRVQYPPHILP